MRNSKHIQHLFGFLFLILGLSNTQDLQAQTLAGWTTVAKVTTDYKIGLDSANVLTGKQSVYLTSSNAAYESFLNIFQRILADEYLGERVRFSFFVKTRIDGEQGMTMPWVRVDGAKYTGIKFDNMGYRPIYGELDWAPYDIVIDIPERSMFISFGVMLLGVGEAWVDNINIEIVDETVETTDEANTPQKLSAEMLKKLLKGTTPKPVNLGFEGN